jgi:prepilin-type N-terminal cleavage/methylation domain-containing protein
MKGFTLIEMLLVLVIISSILYMLFGYVQQKALQMRIDRTTTQMQQILNAGLSYYVVNGKWPVATAGVPVNLTTTPLTNLLQTGGYLPSKITIASPWAGSNYFIYTDAQNKLFYVYTSITVGSATSGGAAAAGNIIAGTLPMAYSTKTNGTPPVAGTSCVKADTTCYVVSSINIPGQNLNNAGAVNYAGLYKHGGCVPVPSCPTDPVSGLPLTPQVVIVPVSVSGLNDPNSTAIYPISSFTAYATPIATLPAAPAACTGSSTAPACDAASTVGNAPASNQYWRACLQVVTEKGNVQTTNTSSASPGSGNAGSGTDYGANVTLMAITRCPIPSESAGSKFTIYSN